MLSLSIQIYPPAEMTTLRPFCCDDLFHYNNVNLDPLTETYNLAFYLMYLSRWSSCCLVVCVFGDIKIWLCGAYINFCCYL